MPNGLSGMLIALAAVGLIGLLVSGSIVPVLVVAAVAWALAHM